MRFKKKLSLNLFLLFNFIKITVLLSQTMVQMNLREVEPKQNLAMELQKLINKVNNCDYYKKSLIWNISVTQSENANILNISMQDYINEDYDYAGFFYLNKTKIIVSGILDENLFTILKSKKIKFKIRDYSKNQIIQIPSPTDYSSWIYLSTQKKIIKVREYLLPCN